MDKQTLLYESLYKLRDGYVQSGFQGIDVLDLRVLLPASQVIIAGFNKRVAGAYEKVAEKRNYLAGIMDRQAGIMEVESRGNEARKSAFLDKSISERLKHEWDYYNHCAKWLAGVRFMNDELGDDLVMCEMMESEKPYSQHFNSLNIDSITKMILYLAVQEVSANIAKIMHTVPFINYFMATVDKRQRFLLVIVDWPRLMLTALDAVLGANGTQSQRHVTCCSFLPKGKMMALDYWKATLPTAWDDAMWLTSESTNYNEKILATHEIIVNPDREHLSRLKSRPLVGRNTYLVISDTLGTRIFEARMQRISEARLDMLKPQELKEVLTSHKEIWRPQKP